MRWIVTKDHHGGCIGLGEDEDGVPARGKPEDGAALPVEFRLYTARGRLLFEGRCGDIAADWWHGMEPQLYTWTTFRCRRQRWTRLVRQFGGLAKVDRVGFYAASRSVISAVA